MYSDDLAAEQHYLVGELLIKLNVAGPSSRPDVAQPENRVPEIADVGLLEAKLVPGFPNRGKPAGTPSLNFCSSMIFIMSSDAFRETALRSAMR